MTARQFYLSTAGAGRDALEGGLEGGLEAGKQGVQALGHIPQQLRLAPACRPGCWMRRAVKLQPVPEVKPSLSASSHISSCWLFQVAGSPE